MVNFAVIDGKNVVNTIVAESKAIAEEVTKMLCIEFGDADRAEPGGQYVDGVFIPKIPIKPYPSWILNPNYVWESPIPHPQVDSENPKDYIWNEELLNWTEVIK